MDSHSWARIYSSARRYQSRSDVYRADEYQEGSEEPPPEFLCPFCPDEFDMVGLCCHIDEEHTMEARNGVCPVCAEKVGPDLVRHMTVEHESLLKVQRRRRFRRGGSNFPFSMFRKELREGKFQSLLGGSSFPGIPSSHDEPDPLLSSFIYNPSVVDEPLRVRPLSSIEACSMSETTVDNPSDRVVQQPKLSVEEQKEKARRCEFVQGLLVSTIFDDNL